MHERNANPRQTVQTNGSTRSSSPAERLYRDAGLAPLPDDAPASDLYLDMVKRAVLNIIYEDPAVWYFDERNQRVLANDFDLTRRLNGTDLPTEAHTMVGLRRLENLQRSIETVLREGVGGDLVEAGVLRGGAAIFMRAVLKARGVRDRRVVACDTFVKRKELPSGLRGRLGVRALMLLASVPGRSWRRWLFFAVQEKLGDQRSFPRVSDPSDHMVDGTMFMLRHLNVMRRARDRTSLDAVRSHFARYGLLDDQVLFLQGFFADTLPGAPIERVAVLRLDGDTYESTKDVLESTYQRLSPGGYCIVDDYHAFPDCRRAVDEYRAAHGIGDELCPIDRHAVYWRRTHAVGSEPAPATSGAARAPQPA